jgi:hypothetical protein
MASSGKGPGSLEGSFSRMSDDELLRLVEQKDALKDVAPQALASELRKRRLNFVAPAVAEAILATAIGSAQKIEQEFWAKASKPGKFRDEHFQDVVAEFVYVFLHLCGRDAVIAIPDPQKRCTFLDSVFCYILQFGKTRRMGDDHPVPAFTRREEWVEPRLLIVSDGMGLVNDREVGYSRLGLFAPQSEPLLKGTVFGEFGNYVTKICDRYEHDPSMQLKAFLLACDGYKGLGPVFVKMHEPPRKAVGFFRRLFE